MKKKLRNKVEKYRYSRKRVSVSKWKRGKQGKWKDNEMTSIDKTPIIKNKLKQKHTDDSAYPKI